MVVQKTKQKITAETAMDKTNEKQKAYTLTVAKIYKTISHIHVLELINVRVILYTN